MRDDARESELHVRIGQAVAAGDYSQARSLLRQLSIAEPHDMVGVVPDLYDECGSFAVLVVTSDHERAATAVVKAARRFLNIGENGREYADVDEADNDEVYTPNYVSDVYFPDQKLGLTFWTDTKDLLNRAMGEAMRRVLTEELIAAAVPAHVCRRPQGLTRTGRVWPLDAK